MTADTDSWRQSFGVIDRTILLGLIDIADDDDTIGIWGGVII